MSLTNRLDYAEQHFPDETQEIRADIADCKIAADWIDNNLVEIMQWFLENIQEKYFTPSGLVTYEDAKYVLVGNIENILLWVNSFMKEGLTPIGKPSLFTYFEKDYYQYLFESFLLKLVPPSKSGLTNAQANQLASYVNRFIIDQL
jgi:hypothetical protein